MVWDDQKRDSPKMAAVSERPVANGGRLRRATRDGPGYGTADPIGSGPGMVLSPLGTLREINQDRNVDLAPSQQIYVKIVSLVSWAVGASGSKNFERDAFYVWLISPEVAQAEISRDRSVI
jgi:hypothetical protein